MRKPSTADPAEVARLPILVGFTGRRELNHDHDRNDHLLGVVVDRFRSVMEWLDRELPLTPKVLICGGDAGSDLAVVTEALSGPADEPNHPLWSVVAKHAFESYAPDPPADAAYRALEAKHRNRFATRVLPPLMEEIPVQANAGTLEEPGPDVPEDVRARFRGAHFEQLALWLASYATVLVAASAAQSAELGKAKPGAVARLVAYRRAAVPDDYAESVIGRSEALLGGSPLDEPDGGYVLWIDPTVEVEPPDDGLPPVQILGPIQEHFNQHDRKISLEEARDAIYREPFGEVPKGGRAISGNARRAFASVITIAHKFEEQNRLALPRWERILGSQEKPQAAEFSEEEPHKFLKRLRAGTAPIGRRQLKEHKIVRRSLRGLIIGFLVAVFFYEGYLELQPQEELWLFFYVAVLASLGLVALCVRMTDAPHQSEDLRGLREILRVQIAWWGSGIDRMVDRVHLRSIDSDLKVIREMAATVTTWAILRTSAKIPVGTCNFGEASAWIEEQVNYHWGRWLSNEGFKKLSQQGANIGLGTALLSLLFLVVIFKPLHIDSDIMSLPPAATASWLGAWIVLSIFAAVEFTEQFTGWRWLRRPRNLGETFTIVGVLVAAAALWSMPLGVERLVVAPWRPQARAAVGGAFILMLLAFWAVRMEWRTKAWQVSKMSLGRKFLCVLATSGFLLGFATIVAPAAPWIGGHTNTLALPDKHAPSTTPAKEPAPLAPGAVSSAAPGHSDPQSASSTSPDECPDQPDPNAVKEGTDTPRSADSQQASSTAPAKDQYCLYPDEVRAAFRALVLTTTTLILAASGMLRYYVERRNHAAQAAQSDDCHRAFLRAQAILRSTQKALEASQYRDQHAAQKARELIQEIGELALDENEAWLRAHRERPVEAMSGA